MASQAFGRAKRLSRSEEFRRLIHEGRAIRFGWWTLRAAPIDRGGRRFGCTVRRAADASAVGRNRLKRWFREAFRRNQERFPEGWALLAMITEAPPAVTYVNVERELLQACESLGRRAGSSG